jgi:hypothetical protein
MTRDAVERGGRDRFSTSLQEWNLLREIATTFGWLPLGTTYVGAADPGSVVPYHSYEPGDARDLKSVLRDDAFAWATALENARVSPHLIAMVQSRDDVAVREIDAARLTGLIDEFVVYLYGGAFTFALPRAG